MKSKKDKNNFSGRLALALKETREKAGLTQQKVAVHRIVSQSKLSKMESGKSVVGFLTLVQLANLYKAPVSLFIPDAFRSADEQVVSNLWNELS